MWVAAVVGVHFLLFGRLFAARFSLIGAVLIIGALLGLLLCSRLRWSDSWSRHRSLPSICLSPDWYRSSRPAAPGG